MPLSNSSPIVKVPPDIRQATQGYEAWLGKRIELIPADVDLKHQRMAESPFAFLRATFYRWVQRWPEVCPELAAAPAVLSVGDLHIENFGTWRDAEGRLIWGINDFDEAYPMPYTNDLVRLAASALLAIGGNHLSLDDQDACEAILAGYRTVLDQGSCPFVLAERHHWLRDLAHGNLRDPVAFWDKLDKLPAATETIAPQVLAALERWLPERGLSYKLVHRIAGLGSLGRQRLVALADWRGGLIAREAKALAVSACLWEQPASEAAEILLPEDPRHGGPRARSVGAGSAARGSSAAWPPIAAASSLRCCPKTATSGSSCRPWARRRPTSTRATPGPRPQFKPTCKRDYGKWLWKAAQAMAQTIQDDWKQWHKTQTG